MPEGFGGGPDPDAAPAWIAAAPGRARMIAQRWGVSQDGSAWSGHLSVVWPVRHDDGRRLALKLHVTDTGTGGEGPFLRAAAGPRVVAILDADAAEEALLIERLDAKRTLATVADIDLACRIIGEIVADVSAVTAPPGVVRMTDELVRVREAIRSQHAKVGAVLPQRLVGRALATLADLETDLLAHTGPLPLVHGDCHFLNVLHTLPDEPPGWKAIDPYPFAGLTEVEVIAPLRNRWADAIASGDPDAHLRRRIDIICQPGGLDPARARAVAQAIAVDNLLWLVPDREKDGFVPPYRVMAEWS